MGAFGLSEGPSAPAGIWRCTKRAKLNYFLGGGVRTEQNNYFLGGRVQTEQKSKKNLGGWVQSKQNSTIFWVEGYEKNSTIFYWYVAGYEQNKIKLFSVWWGTNRTLWHKYIPTDSELYIKMDGPRSSSSPQQDQNWYKGLSLNIFKQCRIWGWWKNNSCPGG